MSQIAIPEKVDGPLAPSSYRSRWASIAIRSNLAEIQKGIPSLSNDVSRHKMVPTQDTLYSDGADDGQLLRVGIIGAGCAGLFTALIFDHLKKLCGLEVEYEILESDSEERIGGRLFSYYFKNVKDPGVHDYYDVGAMRFPDIDIMKRTFDLFEQVCEMKRNKSKYPERGDLIPYLLKGKNTPLLYNDIQVVPKGDMEPTGKDFEITGIDKYDYDTIEWLETYSYGNRWYDQALSEMVLEDLDFNHDKDWWCVEGGSQEAAYRMRNIIEKKKKRIAFHKKVKGMSLTENKEAIDVTIDGESKSRRCDAVFNSAPLGSMQRMDLSGLNLNWGTKQAIRSLGYGASCKVGIRFKSLWWIEHLNIDEGGVAKTDLPLRSCVYPSYNRHDDKTKPGVLLCSYTWSQEAQRIASLINTKSPEGEEELKTLLIDNLAKLHSKTNDRNDYNKFHKIISDSYETHHAYDWYADPGTTGAFAYFGPSQFRKMYPWITRTSGKHIIIGEAASTHHAWVVGALESAVRGVYQFLFKHSATNKAANEALQMYNRGEVKSPYGPLPSEYNRQDDVKYMTGGDPKMAARGTGEGAPLASSEGEWARAQVVFESIRIEQGGDQLVMERVTKEEMAPLIGVAST